MSGYSGPRYDISREEKRLREAFRDQRKMAERRGIIFSLTYSQWLKIWRSSATFTLPQARQAKRH